MCFIFYTHSKYKQKRVVERERNTESDIKGGKIEREREREKRDGERDAIGTLEPIEKGR